MVAAEGLSMKLIESDASVQNGIAESPNKYLGNMLRCLLHAVDLVPKYWVFSLTHAMYIENRAPRTLIKKIPYEALINVRIDLSNLGTFECRIHAKNPGKRPAKLDHHTSNGILLGYTGSMKNIYLTDDKSCLVKMGVRAIFEKAHFTVSKSKAPLAAQTLQTLGYSKLNDVFKDEKFINHNRIDIGLLEKNVFVPTMSSGNKPATSTNMNKK